MKTIIAGSRGFDDETVVLDAVRRSRFTITEVVSGTARGVDKMGEGWANMNNVPIKRFPADWNQYGKRAGYLRNVEMAEYADALIAVYDGESKGTAHMIRIALDRDLPVFVWYPITQSYLRHNYPEGT